jgi:outer membrane protein OmpA-like peptidoglycan-associated protein
MNKRLIVLAVSGLLATSGWTAEKNRASKQESIGIGSGAAIGAAAGGPVGLVIGAAFGGWLGDRFHHEKTERLAAEERSAQAGEKAGMLERRLSGRDREVAQLEAEIEDARLAHRAELKQALALEVFFRTEESALDAATEERLTELAQFVAPIDGALIRLEGHADSRGTEKYNNELSAARAAAVRDALLRGGLAAERIVVEAAGESHATATEADVDGMALERRVVMEIVDSSDGARVAQHSEE